MAAQKGKEISFTTISTLEYKVRLFAQLHPGHSIPADPKMPDARDEQPSNVGQPVLQLSSLNLLANMRYGWSRFD